MRISESMPSRVERVDEFVSSLLTRISPWSSDKKTIFNIQLALHEALVNAVKHGNQMNDGLSVLVDISKENNQLTMQVTDQGEGFDHTLIPDPITPENLEKLNGRGIFLIQNAMDKVEFSDQGRTIKMIKFLKGESK
ncbi:MAG: ATP-binding protein [Candidatus Omnitrophica bacterium]|nr:ATP-binding protein [Candidatus Omnitrophota bacterium]